MERWDSRSLFADNTIITWSILLFLNDFNLYIDAWAIYLTQKKKNCENNTF